MAHLFLFLFFFLCRALLSMHPVSISYSALQNPFTTWPTGLCHPMTHPYGIPKGGFISSPAFIDGHHLLNLLVLGMEDEKNTFIRSWQFVATKERELSGAHCPSVAATLVRVEWSSRKRDEWWCFRACATSHSFYDGWMMIPFYFIIIVVGRAVKSVWHFEMNQQRMSTIIITMIESSMLTWNQLWGYWRIFKRLYQFW